MNNHLRAPLAGIFLSAFLFVFPVWAEESASTLEQLKAACLKEDAQACFAAAQAMDAATATKTHQDSQNELYDKACLLKHPNACLITAIRNRHLPYNKAKEINWSDRGYTLACDVSGEACAEAVADYKARVGETRNPEQLIGMYGRNCYDHSNIESCMEAAQLVDRSGKLSFARKGYLTKACDSGRQDACKTLFGPNHGNDPAVTAKTKFGRGIDDCNAGKLDGCQLAADIAYEKNDQYPGFEKAPLSAVFPYEALCKADRPVACLNLGLIIFRSVYADKKADQRYRLPLALWGFERACQLGDENGCLNLGTLHTFGGRFAGESHALAVAYWDAFCAKSKNQKACDAAQNQRKGGWKTARRAIDPSLPAIERFMLAERELASGDKKVGIETIEWLAEAGETNSQYLLAMTARYGDGALTAISKSMAETLFGLAAEKQHVAAGFELAWPNVESAASTPGVYKLIPQNTVNRLYAAQRAGVPRAAQWVHFHEQMEAAKQQTGARMFRELQETNRNAVNLDAQTVSRAWRKYSDSQSQKKDGTVCAMIYEGARTYQQCMSKDHFNKYYTPNGQ